WTPSFSIKEAGMKSFFLAVVHAFVGMVVTLVVSLRVRGFLSQLHSAGLGVPPQVEFDIVNFLPIFIFLGFSAGYVVYTKIGGKSALWIWIIPILITGARIMTFHSPTVFESGSMAGWKYLFDDVPCSA